MWLPWRPSGSSRGEAAALPSGLLSVSKVRGLGSTCPAKS